MPRPHPRPAAPPVPIAPHHLSTTPLLPAPIGLASSASRPPRAAIRIPLCRHRADPALIAPHHDHRAPPSASCPPCAAAVLHVLRFAARIAPTVRRHPRHPPHLSPRVAAAPGPWLARTAPYASLFRRMREKGPPPGSIRPKCMLFEIKMATSSPHASISGRNRAIQDAWRANLAAKGPLSRRGTRNHAWREDAASAARPFRGSGLRSGRTGFAPCGSGMRHAAWPNGLCALRRGPGLLAACAPPCHLACARRRPRSSPPSCTRRASPPASRPPRPAIRRVAHCGRGEPSIGLFLLPSCCPRRRIASTDARSPAPPEPNPRQPSPGPEPTESRPPMEPPAPTRAPPPRLTLPRGSRCGSGNSREMMR